MFLGCFYVRCCLVDWWIRPIIFTEASHFPLCCAASRPTRVHYVLLASRNNGGGKDDMGPNKHSKLLSEACPLLVVDVSSSVCDGHSKISNPLLHFFIEAVLSHGPSQTQTVPFARVHLLMQGICCHGLAAKKWWPRQWVLWFFIFGFAACNLKFYTFKIPIVTFSWWRLWVSPVGQIWNSHPQIQRSVIVKGSQAPFFPRVWWSLSSALCEGWSRYGRTRRCWRWVLILLFDHFHFEVLFQRFAELFILSLMFNSVLNN